MPAAPAREKAVVARIVRELRKLPLCHARKVYQGGYAGSGEPDIDAVIAGRALKIECKAPGKLHTLTKLQAATLQTWRDAGALTMVVTSWEEVESVLRSEGLIA